MTDWLICAVISVKCKCNTGPNIWQTDWHILSYLCNKGQKNVTHWLWSMSGYSGVTQDNVTDWHSCNTRHTIRQIDWCVLSYLCSTGQCDRLTNDSNVSCHSIGQTIWQTDWYMSCPICVTQDNVTDWLMTVMCPVIAQDKQYDRLIYVLSYLCNTGQCDRLTDDSDVSCHSTGQTIWHTDWYMSCLICVRQDNVTDWLMTVMCPVTAQDKQYDRLIFVLSFLTQDNVTDWLMTVMCPLITQDIA